MNLFPSRAALYCLLPLLLSGPLQATEQFVLTQETIHAEEGGDNIQQVLLTQFNKVSFVGPGNWSVSANVGSKTITLLSKDQRKSMTIGFAEQNPALQPKPDLEKLRKRVMGRYPNIKPVIVEEFACYTDGGVGQGFGLKLQSGNATMSVRLAFIPFENGTVEFTLQAPAEEFPEEQNTFSDLLNSFHIDPLPLKPVRP